MTNVCVETFADSKQHLHRRLLPIPTSYLEMRLYQSRLPGLHLYLYDDNDAGYESDVGSDFSDGDSNDVGTEFLDGDSSDDDAAGYVGDEVHRYVFDICIPYSNLLDTRTPTTLQRPVLTLWCVFHSLHPYHILHSNTLGSVASSWPPALSPR